MATATYESLPQHATEEELGDEVELQDLSSQRRQSVSEHQDGVPKPSVSKTWIIPFFLQNLMVTELDCRLQDYWCTSSSIASL